VFSDAFITSGRTFTVDLAIDTPLAGTLYPTIRAFGYLENRYRDGYGYGFAEQLPFDLTWTLSPVTIAAVPAPMVGTGLPAILMAVAGLIGWRRSRSASR
jgi:hypothetical protein